MSCEVNSMALGSNDSYLVDGPIGTYIIQLSEHGVVLTLRQFPSYERPAA